MPADPDAATTAEPDDPTEAAIYWTKRWADSASLVADILGVVSDIADHAAPISEDENGFIAGGYLVTVGAMHRAIVFLSQHGVPVATPKAPAGLVVIAAEARASERQRIATAMPPAELRLAASYLRRRGGYAGSERYAPMLDTLADLLEADPS